MRDFFRYPFGRRKIKGDETLTTTTLLMRDFFPFLMVLTRVTFALFFLPGFGEIYINRRVRFLMAGMITLFLIGPLSSQFPVFPETFSGLLPYFIEEGLVGIFFGLLARVFFLALETAGSIIAFQSSLSMAMTFNPALAQQGTIVSSLLMTSGLVLFFVFDIHHLVLKGFMGTYVIFPVGKIVPSDDASHLFTQFVNESFRDAVFWSAPFLILNTILFLGLGLLNRLMPQLAVFFIATPVQLFIGLTLLMTVLDTILLSFFQAFEKNITPFLGG